MSNATRFGLALLATVLGASLAQAHYHILLPNRHSVKKDEPVTLLYRWGHPFEHELFDAPEPTRLFVIAPDGKLTELGKQLKKIKHATADKKEVTAYQLQFTPEQRGDYTFVLQAAPVFLEEDGKFVQDIVKVVVHVQAQKHWDAALRKMVTDRDNELSVIPLTRPYGLQPGMVFQAQFLLAIHHPDTRDAAFTKAGGYSVEIERFNATPPKKLPPDEHITRTAKTDPNGVVTCTLSDPGWWSVTALMVGGTRKHNGKSHPVVQRTTFWVHVDEKISGN
jgi:uncharacterized GH25 family protein